MRNENSSEAVFSFLKYEFCGIFRKIANVWDPLQCMVTSSSEPLEAFAVPNALASVRPLFSSLLFTPLTLHLLNLQFYTFIYCFSINTSHPPLPTYHYFKLLPFFYCSDLSLIPFFHKPLLTQHKAR